jgi:hypothetical protein
LFNERKYFFYGGDKIGCRRSVIDTVSYRLN